MPSDRAREILHRAYMQGWYDREAAFLGSAKPQTAKRKVAVRLLTELREGPRPATEMLALATELGVHTNTVNAAKVELRVTSVQRHDGWYWTLPPIGEGQNTQNTSYTHPDEKIGQDA